MCFEFQIYQICDQDGFSLILINIEVINTLALNFEYLPQNYVKSHKITN